MIEIKIPEEVTQQPCEDCISRKEALSHKHIVYDDDGIGYSVVSVDEIMALPSVTPKAEIEKEEPAEWIVDTDDSRRWDRVRFYCSACNGWNTYGKSKYCPDCGRRMQREGLQRENS